jgi:RluA family pseudouridine synthase
MNESIVPADLDGQRIDIVLTMLNPHLSRRKIRRLLDVGGVYKNNKRINIASRVVQKGDRLLLQEAYLKQIQPSLELRSEDILYVDKDLIVVSKPQGLPSQATRDQNRDHVVACLKRLAKHADLPFTAKEDLFLVHRLDKDTSGILLVARSAEASTHYMQQFKDRNVHKTYYAIVHGKPHQSPFSVEDHLKKNTTGRVSSVKSGGQFARTDFELVATKGAKSLIRAKPLTGRMHQIRIHLANQGLPIVGDRLYGPQSSHSDAPHHLLHCAHLRIQSPSQKWLEFEAPWREMRVFGAV